MPSYSQLVDHLIFLLGFIFDLPKYIVNFVILLKQAQICLLREIFAKVLNMIQVLLVSNQANFDLCYYRFIIT